MLALERQLSDIEKHLPKKNYSFPNGKNITTRFHKKIEEEQEDCAMEQFGGDKKIGRSFLTGPETRLKNWAVPKISPEIETYHLTLTTLLWSFINILIGFEAKEHLSLLWLVSLMILLQYLTDLFDGELGRQRDTGLIKWGFYMDHFLDYIFLCSLVFVGYMISPAGLEIWYFALLVILGGFMVNSFLAFGATNEFQIYHYGIGPTEMRVVFILINTFIISFGTDSFNILLPLTVILCFIGLLINTLQVHGRLWQYDMQVKGLQQEKIRKEKEG